MKTFYLIVSVTVILLFFWVLGKSGEQPERPAVSNTQDITNYVPDVLKDSATSDEPDFTINVDSVNSGNDPSRLETLNNGINQSSTRLDSLQKVRNNLSGVSEPSENHSKSEQAAYFKPDNINQEERTALLHEIKELLKNNQ